MGKLFGTDGIRGVVGENLTADLAFRTGKAIAEEEGKLSGEGRVLVRPSGTEALIRVMVEAKTEQIALLAAENLVNVIKML